MTVLTLAWRVALLGSLAYLGFLGVRLLGEFTLMRRVLEGACDIR